MPYTGTSFRKRELQNRFRIEVDAQIGGTAQSWCRRRFFPVFRRRRGGSSAVPVSFYPREYRRRIVKNLVRQQDSRRSCRRSKRGGTGHSGGGGMMNAPDRNAAVEWGPPCRCLAEAEEEGEEERPWRRRRRFPKAELCVAGGALCGFLVASGLTLVTLHYTVESRRGFHSLAEHLRIATPVLGLSFVVLAGALCLGALFAYAVWKVAEVVEMAHRYRRHREVCEERRRSRRLSKNRDDAPRE